MKKQHILLPAILVIAAVIAGAVTIVGGLSDRGDIATQGGAQVSIISVSQDMVAAAAGANARVIRWSSQNYPAGEKVTINLLQKVSENPDSYTFVRSIAANTDNDGSESWTLSVGETGDTFYVEVVCATQPLSGSCRSAAEPVRAF